MPSYNDSPMTRLAKRLLAEPHPLTQRALRPDSIYREEVYRTAADECAHARANGRFYDPADDARFHYACEWVEILAGFRRRFSPHLEISVRFIFTPIDELLSPKDLAAGERRETHTLAQG